MAQTLIFITLLGKVGYSDSAVQTSFLDDVCQINVPTLVVQNSNDPWTEMSFVGSYYANLTVEKQMLLLDLEKNRFAAYEHLDSNLNGIYEWFDKYM